MSESDKAYHEVEGVKLYKFFPEENARFGLNYEAVDDDVFLATYPKTGTTWTAQILFLIMHNGEIPDGDLDDHGMFMECHGSAKFATLKRPFVNITHLPRNKLSWNSKAKYVIVARNPKDVLVSYFHHLTKQLSIAVDIHEFRKLWLDGDCAYGDYFDWLDGWTPYLNEPNVKLVFYEEMKLDISESILDLAKFLGYDLATDSPLLAEIVKKSSLDHMKVQLQGSIAAETRVRKGQVGGWKDELSAEDVYAVDEKCRHRLADGPFARLCD
ncbi:Amine sulfotransferase [Halotydeus destructor]|nr:Amine sulfotransferase [Halotydeus destructor]